MTKTLREAVDKFLNAKAAEGINIVQEHVASQMARKFVELKKAIQARLYEETLDEKVVERQHNHTVADIHAAGEHIGHIEHALTHRGNPSYRVVSYTEAHPHNEFHKSLDSAKREAHSLVARHVTDNFQPIAAHEEIKEGAGNFSEWPVHSEKHVLDQHGKHLGNVIHHKKYPDTNGVYTAEVHHPDGKWSEKVHKTREDAVKHILSHHEKDVKHRVVDIGEEIVDEAKDPEDRQKEKERDLARASGRKGKEDQRQVAEGIETPNSSGQGHDVDHVNHPLHKTTVSHGYDYSHTTPIKTASGHLYNSHTYQHKNNPEFKVSLHHSNLWSTTNSPASGHQHSGKGDPELKAHLKSKNDRYDLSLRKKTVSESAVAHKAGGRVKTVKVRVRNGKVQRRKKVSNVKGYKISDGKVERMSATERRHRKLGAKRSAMKRRGKKGQIHRKLLASLKRRKAMGV